MALRWTAAGLLEAERQFRKITGYTDLAAPVTRIDHERQNASRRRRPLHSRPRNSSRQSWNHHPAKFHDKRDNLECRAEPAREIRERLRGR